MKAGHSCRCLFWATLYYVLYLAASSDDELLDFDFSAPKEVDWNFDQDDVDLASDVNAAVSIEAKKKLETNMLDFSVDIEDDDDVQPHLPRFDWREKVLRNALAKALTDKALRQKFAEVMPILRVLTSQQRLALSALIFAQMNAKHGQGLKLEQVRLMFGDDKKLLLPIVYDLANLVKNSARKYLQFGNELSSAALYRMPIVEKRKLDLSAEQLAEDDEVGTIRVTADEPWRRTTEAEDELPDFLADMSEEFLDPQKINEELQAEMSLNGTATKTTAEASAKRTKRAAQELVHKLMRASPLSVNEEDIMRGAVGRTIKLNTTAFFQPNESTRQAIATPATTYSSLASTEQPTSLHTLAADVATQSYMEIEDLAFASLNGTEVELNPNERSDLLRSDEPLPNPEELIAGPRYRLSGGNKVSGIRGGPVKRKRIQSRPRAKAGVQPPAGGFSNVPVVSPPKKCERFTASMCIRTDDYPFEQIMGSIRRHKNAMAALLAEFYDKPNHNLELGDEFDDYVVNNKRREDEGSAGGMCQSVVRYARPQKARSASGEWKYIVNTGQHTQTLRLEKCSNPGESCSYLAQTYRSHCSQVYNYHRLLSWDKMRGLHVDIFKVPTCCSCQVDGYRQQFPPLASSQSKDYTPANYHPDNGGYSTINEDDLDYNDESEEDDINFAHFNGAGNSIGHHHQQQKRDPHIQDNELFSSKNVRTKVNAPPTVGSYLSPPGDEYSDSDFTAYKRQQHGGGAAPASQSSSLPSPTQKKHYNQVTRRRPHNEARVDLDLSPSELHTDKEVNIFGTPLPASNKPRVPHKRKRIYSAPHTANGGVSATYATSTAASAANAHQTVVSQQSQQSQQQQQQFTSAATGVSTSSGGGHEYVNRNLLGPVSVSKSRPRFYAPITTPSTGTPIIISNSSPTSSSSSSGSTATPSSKPAQQRTTQQQPSTPLPPAIYHVNSIYSVSNYNGSASQAGGAKRINYNYHPIIDFFDKHKRTDVTALDEFGETQERTGSDVTAHIYPHSISSSSKSPVAAGGGLYQPQPTARRIGYGAGGNGGGGGVGFGVGVNGGFHVQQSPFGDSDNAWHPVVVAS